MLDILIIDIVEEDRQVELMQLEKTAAGSSCEHVQELSETNKAAMLSDGIAQRLANPSVHSGIGSLQNVIKRQCARKVGALRPVLHRSA